MKKVFRLHECKSFVRRDARVEIDDNGQLALFFHDDDLVLEENCRNLSYEMINWETAIVLLHGKKTYKMAIYTGERGFKPVEGDVFNARVTGGVFDEVNRHRDGIPHPENPRGLVPPHVQDLLDALDAYGATRVEGVANRKPLFYAVAAVVAAVIFLAVVIALL